MQIKKSIQKNDRFNDWSKCKPQKKEYMQLFLVNRMIFVK